MTVSTSQIRVSYNGDGTTVIFPIPFPFYLTTDLLVILAGNTITSGFSVSGGNGSTGTLTMSSAPTGAQVLQIVLNVPLTQLTNLVDGTAFPSATINQVNDRSIQAALRLQDQVSRSIRAPDGDSSPGMMLPSATSRASMYLAFDSNGNTLPTAALPGTANTQASLGPILNPQTDAESVAHVLPTNYLYLPAPLVDARRYGVIADGTTDNAIALGKFVAVLKQTPGSAGILPSGTINCSSLTALSFNSTVGISLQGGSALNGTKLVYTGTGSGNFIDARSSFGFSLSYVSLYHSNSGFTGNLISFSHDGSANDSQHGHLFRCAFGSIGSLYTATGVQLDQSTLITIENCDIGALRFPIAGQNSAGGSYAVGIRILNCQFAGYGFYAIYYGGAGWKIIGNNFQPNKDGLVEVFTANVNTPCDGFQFLGNTVLDASAPSVVLVMYAAAAMDISGNVAGCGGGGSVFLQANGIIQGLSMNANHISQATTGIQVSNVAHVGWAVNGNYFDTVTTPIDHPEDVTGINLEGNTPNIMKRWFQQRITVTYSPSMTLDVSQGNAFDIVAINGTAFTINAPANPIDAQRISIRIVNGAGIPLGAVTWNAIFKMSAWTQPAANQNRTIDFEYNSTFSFWYQVSQTGVDVPN